ncbi:MAG: hypothetical protein ACYCYO_00280 [Bacilli bacterium]
MTRDEIQNQMVALIKSKHYTYADIASRLGITSSNVGRILIELRNSGILPAAERRYERRSTRLAQPINPVKYCNFIHYEEIAISR